MISTFGDAVTAVSTHSTAIPLRRYGVPAKGTAAGPSAPLLTGRELIAAGYTPGPMFGVVLSEIEDAQLEGRISTAAEALEMARRKLG